MWRQPAQNYRCYEFDKGGEERVTAWMQEHLRVAVAAHPDPKAIEGQLIAEGEPPLNLTGWPNPYASEIKQLRKLCADEARRDHPR